MLLWFIPSFIIEGHIKFQLGVSGNEDAFYFCPLSSWPSRLEASAFSTAVAWERFLRAFLCFVCVHPRRRIFLSHGFQSKLTILKFLLPNLDVSALNSFSSSAGVLLAAHTKWSKGLQSTHFPPVQL